MSRKPYVHSCFTEEHGYHEEEVYSHEIGDEDCKCAYCGKSLLTYEEAVKFIYKTLFKSN